MSKMEWDEYCFAEADQDGIRCGSDTPKKLPLSEDIWSFAVACGVCAVIGAAYLLLGGVII